MIIHIIGTITGQINEGMRNVATHLSKEFEKENTVLYSGLRQILQIIIYSKKSDVTLIFARANKMIYMLTRIVTIFCHNTWVVLVQKPDSIFIDKNNRKTLKCNYLSITKNDMEKVKILNDKRKELFKIGINLRKFTAVNEERQKQLKIKYGFDSEKPLIIHVGHCSKGRGLEDFLRLKSVQRMVVASGLFEDEKVVKLLKSDGVVVHTGYLENIEEIYQMADIYLFPTKSTEFVISIPLSVMEALSSGVPVIGYKSFKNLNEISSVDGAISLIDNVDEINDVLLKVMRKKSKYSLLKNTHDWEISAIEVLKIIKEK